MSIESITVQFSASIELELSDSFDYKEAIRQWNPEESRSFAELSKEEQDDVLKHWFSNQVPLGTYFTDYSGNAMAITLKQDHPWVSRYSFELDDIDCHDSENDVFTVEREAL